MSSHNNTGYGYYKGQQFEGFNGGDPGNYALYPQHGVQSGGGPGVPAYGDHAEFTIPTNTIAQSGRTTVNRPLYNTRTSQVVSIHSKDRNTATDSNPNNYWINLPATYEGVQSVELLHAQVPNTYYNVRHNDNDTLALIFTNNTVTATQYIKVPEGFYTLGDLSAVIQDLLNGLQQTAPQDYGANKENHNKTYSRQLAGIAHPSGTTHARYASNSNFANYAVYMPDVTALTGPGYHIANFRVGFTWPYDDRGLLVNAGLVDSVKRIYIANVLPNNGTNFTTAVTGFTDADRVKLAFSIDVSESTILTLLGFTTTSDLASTESPSYKHADEETDSTLYSPAYGHQIVATNLADTSGLHYLNLCIDGLGLFKFATTSGSENLEVFAKVPLTAEFGGFSFYQPTQLTNVKRFPELLPSLRRLHIRWTDSEGNLINFRGVEHDFSVEINCDRIR